jgi:fatty acyl-CoA reductase
VKKQTYFNFILFFQLFDHLRSEDPKSFDKLVSVSADVMEPEMGISTEDEKELIENVSVVFHAAATVKFDEALKVSINMNVQGTQRVVALCQKMKKLAVSVFINNNAHGSFVCMAFQRVPFPVVTVCVSL